MPIREYQAKDHGKGCAFCRAGFEKIQRLNEKPLEKCPFCGAELKLLISAPSIGPSKTGLDDRAKSTGFHKLKKLGKGEYEKLY
jgi:putative FmdB family regulatory protein